MMKNNLQLFGKLGVGAPVGQVRRPGPLGRLSVFSRYLPLFHLLFLSLLLTRTGNADCPSTYEHVSWSSGAITWTNDIPIPSPSISSATEYYNETKSCESINDNPHHGPVGYVKTVDEIRLNAGVYERHVKYVAYGITGSTDTVEGSKAVGKTWSAGHGIGSKLVSGSWVEDGFLTAPQNQSTSPATPAKVVAGPGRTLSCAVDTPTDMDHWQIGGTAFQGEEADGIASYTWSCSGGGFVDGSGALQSTATGRTATWKAPLTPGVHCSISCTIKDTPAAVSSPNVGSRDDGDLVRSVGIEVWKTSMRVKRLGIVSDDAFGDSATVAAGNISNDGHRAKVELRVTDSADIPIPNVTPDLPIVVGGGQGPADDVVNASVSAPSGVTDSNGKAYVTFTSGSRVERTILQIPDDPSAEATTGPVVEIEQVWNGLDEDAWDYPPTFVFNTPATINYKMEFSNYGDDIRIKGHSTQFVTIGLAGLELDTQSGPDDNDDGIPDGLWVPASYTATDNDSTGFLRWKGLSTFGAASESDGIYSANQTVASDPNFEVQTVTFNIVDGSAYDAN